MTYGACDTPSLVESVCLADGCSNFSASRTWRLATSLGL
jgi:hypothetical protein